MDRDTFFDPSQALEFGVIDSILTKRSAAAVVEEGK
jgi:ATP-dependent protease ClpP protease subunit